MSGEIGSMRPNPYLFDIENRKKRKPRLAHDLGAGARCRKCGDKCPGFELHFWRKICMNCRCGKDDHEVEDDDEDIGQIVIGKLFDRPARTEREELEYCHGNDLEIINEETGKAENVKFDWVPPNVEKTLASRYMELLPPEKRPIAGSEAAKARRRQLEQQIPLYDMDAGKRSDTLPPEELQNFQAYLERIRTQVAGQGTVQEITGASVPLTAQPIISPRRSDMKTVEPFGGNIDANGNIGHYIDTFPGDSVSCHALQNQANFENNNIGTEESQGCPMHDQPLYRSSNLRQQFLGGMVGEPGGISSSKLPGDTAFSTPYGGQPMNASTMQGATPDKSVESLSSGISDLKVQPNLPESAQGDKPFLAGQAEYKMENQKKIPPPVAPKGHRSVKPGHFQQYGTQSVFAPGYQPPLYHSEQPLEAGIEPYQLQCFQPSLPRKFSEQPGYQPPHDGTQQNLPGYGQVTLELKPGHPANQQEGIMYTENSSSSEQPPPIFESTYPGYQIDQPTQLGYQPSLKDYQPQLVESSIQTDDQEFPAPPPELLGYPPGHPGFDTALMDNDNVYDNVGAKLRARLDGEGVSSPLQQMLAKERNISAMEATQAPYGAQVDTLTGGMSIAPGSDVTVLFPGESRLLGTPAKNKAVRGHKSKYSCQGCAQPMNVGDVAIFCERAGSDKCWHPSCFCCFTCKELLADLIYFYKDDKVFCGRHFTDAEEMPRCKSCDELIFGNTWTRADGFDWHINHFCCNVCDSPMAGQRYVPDQNGYPYCLPCYMTCVAKMCESCEEKISPEVNRCGHRGYFFHATVQCFKCYSCSDPLLGKRFKMSKNWVFCSNDCIQKAAEDLASNPNPKIKEEV